MNTNIALYEQFIQERKQRPLSGSSRTEIHHILPKSLGGTDHPENLIELTLREHYIAHLILWKAYGGQMARAFHMMTTTRHLEKVISSRMYAELKNDLPVCIPKGYKFSVEHNRKISEARKGENYGMIGPNHPFYGKRHSIESLRKMSENNNHMGSPGSRSEKTKKKISEARKGKHLSEETKNKISKAVSGENHPFYGKKHSDETRAKLREAWKRRKAKQELLKSNSPDSNQ